MFERDPIFTEVGERLKLLGIKGVLLDLDDTLIFVSEIFVQWMEEYSRRVAEKTGLDTALVLGNLKEINDDEYKKMGVSPGRWKVVVEKLVGRFPEFEREIVGNLEILMRIYTTIPRMRLGIKAMLEVFREAGVKMGLVTHANEEWTFFKLDSLGLWNHFDEIVIADEKGHKKVEDWKRGMDALGLSPEECLIVGDNLGGDIRPGDELGARTVWMPSPWSVYRQGEVPKRTIEIKEIFDLLAAVERLR